MSDRDPTAEQAITEIAEILAKGYLRLLETRRQPSTGSEKPPDSAGVNKSDSTAKRKTGSKSKMVQGQPEPLPPRHHVSTTSRPAIPESVHAEIAERLQDLAEMNLSELRAEYQRIFSQAARSSNQRHLFRRIAWEIQAQAEVRLPEEVRQYACRIAEQTDLFRRVDGSLKKRASATPSGSTVTPQRGHRPQLRKTRERDPRIPPPGSLLIVKRGRQTVRVTVLESGFECAGKLYRSLTAVARQVTSRNVNAYEFFGLGSPTEPESDS